MHMDLLVSSRVIVVIGLYVTLRYSLKTIFLIQVDDWKCTFKYITSLTQPAISQKPQCRIRSQALQNNVNMFIRAAIKKNFAHLNGIIAHSIVRDGGAGEGI